MIGLAEQSYKIKKILIDKVGQVNQLIKLFSISYRIIVNITVCFFTSGETSHTASWEYRND